VTTRSSSARVRFGPFAFDPSTGELWQDGRRARLQRQPSRLLALLLARPGEVVTRDEIRQAIWGDDTYVDFERSLNFCVAKLRSALRENAAAPRYVETLPTRGYRFIAPLDAPVSVAKEDSPVGDPILASTPAADRPSISAAPATPADPRRPATLWTAAGSAALIAVVALITLTMTRATRHGGPTIVVVPFHNETGSADLDRVAKGVSDATVARLATPERLPQLKVIGNASDVAFSFKPANMKAIGESLGAQFLVLGQLKKDDRQMRIVAHLIRVSDQTHVWAKTYDAPVLDLQKQADIAEEIATAVVATVPRG
jgi:TolB-like protein/DNA-binding winged helix-turn-helix (wHTH) protein